MATNDVFFHFKAETVEVNNKTLNIEVSKLIASLFAKFFVDLQINPCCSVVYYLIKSFKFVLYPYKLNLIVKLLCIIYL